MNRIKFLLTNCYGCSNATGFNFSIISSLLKMSQSFVNCMYLRHCPHNFCFFSKSLVVSTFFFLKLHHKFDVFPLVLAQFCCSNIDLFSKLCLLFLRTKNRILFRHVITSQQELTFVPFLFEVHAQFFMIHIFHMEKNNASYVIGLENMKKKKALKFKLDTEQGRFWKSNYLDLWYVENCTETFCTEGSV